MWAAIDCRSRVSGVSYVVWMEVLTFFRGGCGGVLYSGECSYVGMEAVMCNVRVYVCMCHLKELPLSPNPHPPLC